MVHAVRLIRIPAAVLWISGTLTLFAEPPEQRAVRYLAGEVREWSKANGCFSCHNNGDGARALFVAVQKQWNVPVDALIDTRRWLQSPERWDANRGNPAVSDKKLARIQFTAALAVAVATGNSEDRGALRRAAHSLIPLQDRDGSWRIDETGVGSPATWGSALTTWLARRTLEQAGAAEFRESISAANAWLQALRPSNTLDAAARLLALPDKAAGEIPALLAAQSTDGGWGPRKHVPPEVFDTAVVLLALGGLAGRDTDVSDAIQRGREFLIRAQLPPGGWPETTRPSGGQSYAQHVSTSAWATLALLATGNAKP
jgi:hypothetical protein